MSQISEVGTNRVSHKRNCLFIWVPKTAGSSIFNWLADEIGMTNLKRPNEFKTFPNCGAVTFAHVHYLSLVSVGIVSQDFHDSAYKFAVVRDPYTRAVSLYHYLRSRGIYDGEFVKFLWNVRCRRTPIGLYNSSGLSQTNPQTSWLINGRGHLIPDEVFRVENLMPLETRLQENIGFTASRQIGRDNVSQQSEATEELLRSHPEIIPIIEEVYYSDFFFFNYPRYMSDT